MITVVWLRQDLRLTDNRAWHIAAERGHPILALYLLPEQWRRQGLSGLDRLGAAKTRFLCQAIKTMKRQLQSLDIPLADVVGSPMEIIPALAEHQSVEVITAAAQAPEEAQWLTELCDRGISVTTVETQCLLDYSQAPANSHELPATFSGFRRLVEKEPERAPARPLAAPASLPAGATIPSVLKNYDGACETLHQYHMHQPAKAFGLEGGETQALDHLKTYLCQIDKVRSYKETRNQLCGDAFSSRLSGYLSTGALSARFVWHALLDWEGQHGASNGSYWLRFELLWREFFHWSMRVHGRRIFRYNGLSNIARQQHSNLNSRQRHYWSRWCQAQTGLPCIDAPLNELMATGWISNRARQLLASFLVHDMGLDWRWGAEFFQHYLVDDDPASNWGNWAYIAGVGHDARGGRHFSAMEQTFRHDPEGAHMRLWLPALGDVPTAKLRQMHIPGDDTAPEVAYPRPMLYLAHAHAA